MIGVVIWGRVWEDEGGEFVLCDEVLADFGASAVVV